jgi:TPR repeat protein
MHRLSCYLELGAAGPRDEEGSLFYLKQAAKNGDVESMVSLGIKYGKGTIVPLSERKSAKWYLRAAENGDEFATRILLDAPWSWSQGTVRNSEKLFARCITDATSGKTKAMIRIGRMFLEANGVPFTPDEYLKWFHMAAEAKSTEAMLELSHIHAMGKGVEQSCEKSIYWIQRAAQTGDTLAMKKMGEIYKEGKGVPQSDSEAAKWYLLAAEKGDALAMVIFGLMQKKGIGVELNEEAAYKWFKRADEKADTTDRIFIEDFLQRNLHRS